MKRCEYLDNAKGIGILLLMFGHTSGLPSVVYEFIFSFHVPLFFFISGYLMSDKITTGGFLPNLLRITNKTLTPLFFYFALSYCLWVTRVVFDIGVDESTSSLLSPIYQLVSGNVNFTNVNSTLWYFLCMYNVFIIYIVASRIFSNEYFILMVSFLVVFVLIYFGMFSMSERARYNIDTALMALPFFCLGRLDKKHLGLTSKDYQGKEYVIILVITIFLCLSLANGKVDLNKFDFGNSSILYYLNSVLGIFITLHVSKLLRCKCIRSFNKWLSYNSIFIFPSHMVIYSLITGAFLFSFGFNVKDYSGFLLSFFYVIVALLILCLAIRLWPKKLNFIIGK